MPSLPSALVTFHAAVLRFKLVLRLRFSAGATDITRLLPAPARQRTPSHWPASFKLSEVVCKVLSPVAVGGTVRTRDCRTRVVSSRMTHWQSQ